MTLTPAQIEFDDQGRLVSTAYGDIYFQPEHSIAESEYVFLNKGGFYDAVQNGAGDLTVAELGFGTGLNFLLCLQAWQKRSDKTRRLHYISFEKHPIQKNDLLKIYDYWPELSDYSAHLIASYPPLVAGIHPRDFTDMGASLTLALDDVRRALPDMDFAADIWFLDGFAPAKNPDMWAEKLWRPLARNTKLNAKITTFTAAGAVRRGLGAAGFEIEKVKGYGRKRDMVIGTLKDAPPSKAFDAKHLPISKHSNIKNAAIIGAGIAGCSLAEAMTRHGINVNLYDKNEAPAMEASENARAAVYPKLGAINSAADQIYRQAFTYTCDFYSRLKNSTYVSCGVFQIDRNADAKARHEKIAARGFPENFVRYVPRDTVSGLDLKEGGLFFPNAGCVSPPEVCRALLTRADKTGRLKTHYNFDFKKPGDVTADIIILADAENIISLPQTKSIPIEIVRGQITEWSGNTVSQNLKTVLCHKGYITPYDNGHILGATFDKGPADDHAPRDENHVRNMTQLFEELPAIKSDYDIKTLSGRRANRIASPDRLPLCGSVPDHDQFIKAFEGLKTDAKITFQIEPPWHEILYVMGALGSHGMTTAPWLAEILARQLSGAPVPLTVENYNALMPARFTLRELIKSK